MLALEISLELLSDGVNFPFIAAPDLLPPFGFFLDFLFVLLDQPSLSFLEGNVHLAGHRLCPLQVLLLVGGRLHALPVQIGRGGQSSGLNWFEFGTREGGSHWIKWRAAVAEARWRSDRVGVLRKRRVCFLVAIMKHNNL